MFKRKAYDALTEWKDKYSNNYAALLEGARRVGKSTIAEEFAKNNFKTYIKIDFANITHEMSAVFDDIADLDNFFLRIQAVSGTILYEKESVIIFDEIQLAPEVRQAIKYLVADGRYYYIETGSLISIKKNVKNIVIPSEEHKIQVFPMDYEEFMLATGKDCDILRKLYKTGKPVGDSVNRKLMRDLRIYMAVGGMPQAVDAYINKNSFEDVDRVKREIISLYEDDFHKIDPSGRISNLYEAVPSQLSSNKNRFIISNALGKRTTNKDLELFSELLSSKTVLLSYNTMDPSVSLSQTKSLDSYKVYLSDTGLFTTLLFNAEEETNKDIYIKLMGDKLSANLGYLYENLVAQMIAASGKKLYYHTWKKNNSSHSYEIDFLISSHTKIVPFEVKSSSVRFHASITEFSKKYSSKIHTQYLLSQKDVGNDEMLLFRPIYMLPFILEEM
ncbi:MAG: ATP-binding protein [Eubacterium sp.]|nr:ATP-binding protein [Eubacterium sp.]